MNGWCSKMVDRGSHCNPWKAICNGLESFLAFIQLKVGMGDRTRFWEDVWISDLPFPRIYRVSCKTSCLITSMVSWKSSNSLSCDLSFRRNLNNREVDEFMSLMSVVGNASLSKNDPDRYRGLGKSRDSSLVNRILRSCLTLLMKLPFYLTK